MNLSTALKPVFSTRSLPVSIGSGLSFFNSVQSKKGVAVNQNSTLTLSAFFNAVDIITNDFAKLPKAVYKKIDGGREKQAGHPVNYLISKRPNSFMTAFMHDKMLILHAIFKGNGYSEIIRNENATPIAFQLIDQDQHPVQVVSHQGKLFYKFNNRIISGEDMIHIPGFSFNGITGVSVITYAANSIGINLSSQEFAGDYYNSKGIGLGVITTTKEMNPDAKIRYGTALGDVLSSKGSGYKAAVIDEAGSFTNLKITPQEAEFLKTHKSGVEECARWLNIPLYKLKAYDNINNSITEQLEISHVSDSILPWAIKAEQEFTIKTLTHAELAADFYIKANVNALLRADTKTKTEYYAKAITWGWLTRNEVRALEDLNSIEGLDEILQPVNMQTLDQIEQLIKDSKNE